MKTVKKTDKPEKTTGIKKTTRVKKTAITEIIRQGLEVVTETASVIIPIIQTFKRFR